MNHTKIVRWLESPQRGYSGWQRLLLWLTKPYRGWFWKRYFSRGVVITRHS